MFERREKQTCEHGIVTTVYCQQCNGHPPVFGGESDYERNQRELREAGFDAYTSDEIDEFPNMNRR